MVNFIFIIIEVFGVTSYGWDVIITNLSKSAFVEGGGSLWAQISDGMGRRSPTTVGVRVVRIAEWLPFCVVSKYPQCIVWFCHITRVWQTDRRTDGQNYDSQERTSLAARAVKMARNIIPINARKRVNLLVWGERVEVGEYVQRHGTKHKSQSRTNDCHGTEKNSRTIITHMIITFTNCQAQQSPTICYHCLFSSTFNRSRLRCCSHNYIETEIKTGIHALSRWVGSIPHSHIIILSPVQDVLVPANIFLTFINCYFPLYCSLQWLSSWIASLVI